MSNKIKLQEHATDLQSILDTINSLPEAGADAYAVIAVSYPEGSVCICSNGSETLELDNTVGYGFFLVPSDGEWTVTATDGTNSKSQSVSITAEGQFESVTLSFQLILFDGGDNTAVTGGWDYDGRETEPIITDELGLDIEDEGIKAWVDEYWILATVNKIDLSNYTKLCANITGLNVNGDGDEALLCVGNDIAWNSWPTARQLIEGTGKVTLDISDINSGHIALRLTIVSGAYSQWIGSVYASKIWLE